MFPGLRHYASQPVGGSSPPHQSDKILSWSGCRYCFIYTTTNRVNIKFVNYRFLFLLHIKKFSSERL